jgi:hypothetical protein
MKNKNTRTENQIFTQLKKDVKLAIKDLVIAYSKHDDGASKEDLKDQAWDIVMETIENMMREGSRF